MTYLSNRGKVTITTLRKLAEEAAWDDVYKPSKAEWESVASIPFTHSGYLLRKGNYKKIFRSARACYDFLEPNLIALGHS